MFKNKIDLSEHYKTNHRKETYAEKTTERYRSRDDSQYHLTCPQTLYKEAQRQGRQQHPDRSQGKSNMRSRDEKSRSSDDKIRASYEKSRSSDDKSRSRDSKMGSRGDDKHRSRDDKHSSRDDKYRLRDNHEGFWDKKECKFYNEGRCKFGRKCWNAHSDWHQIKI